MELSIREGLEHAKQFNAELRESIARLAGLQTGLDALDEELKQAHKFADIVEEQEQSARLLMRRELQLTRANERLRDLDQIKSNFVSVAAHQMRTPLSGIRWGLTMALSGDLGPVSGEQKDILGKVLKSTENLIHLIADLLDVDRLDTGAFLYNPEPFNLCDLIESVVSDLSQSASVHAVNIINTCPSPATVFVDSAKTRVVVQNLVENAIKYTPSGGSVMITSRILEDKSVEMAVRDTGIGIPEEEQRFVFNRFFRSSNAMHSQTEGSGLGLYITHEIVERMGGSIRFESLANNGTTFFVTLPSKPTPPREEPIK